MIKRTWIMATAVLVLGFVGAGCKTRGESTLQEARIASIESELQSISDENLAKLTTEERIKFQQFVRENQINPIDLRATGEIEGDFESRGLFHYSKGSVNGRFGEGVSETMTHYRGMVVNEPEIDRMIDWLNEKIASGYSKKDIAGSAVNALVKLKDVASTKVADVQDFHSAFQSSVKNLRLILGEIEARQLRDTVQDGATKAKLREHLLWGRSTSFAIQFRTDTDSMKTSCEWLMLLETRESATIYTKPAAGSSYTCKYRKTSYGRRDVDSLINDEDGIWLKERLY